MSWSASRRCRFPTSAGKCFQRRRFRRFRSSKKPTREPSSRSPFLLTTASPGIRFGPRATRWPKVAPKPGGCSERVRSTRERFIRKPILPGINSIFRDTGSAIPMSIPRRFPFILSRARTKRQVGKKNRTGQPLLLPRVPRRLNRRPRLGLASFRNPRNRYRRHNQSSRRNRLQHRVYGHQCRDRYLRRLFRLRTRETTRRNRPGFGSFLQNERHFSKPFPENGVQGVGAGVQSGCTIGTSWKRDENGHLVTSSCRTHLPSTCVNVIIYAGCSSGRRLFAGGLSCRLRYVLE